MSTFAGHPALKVNCTPIRLQCVSCIIALGLFTMSSDLGHLKGLTKTPLHVIILKNELHSSLVQVQQTTKKNIHTGK